MPSVFPPVHQGRVGCTHGVSPHGEHPQRQKAYQWKNPSTQGVNLVASYLNTSFENVGNSKLFGDFTQIVRLTFVFFRGRARDHFKIRDL